MNNSNRKLIKISKHSEQKLILYIHITQNVSYNFSLKISLPPHQKNRANNRKKKKKKKKRKKNGLSICNESIRLPNIF